MAMPMLQTNVYNLTSCQSSKEIFDQEKAKMDELCALAMGRIDGRMGRNAMY